MTNQKLTTSPNKTILECFENHNFLFFLPEAPFIPFAPLIPFTPSRPGGPGGPTIKITISMCCAHLIYILYECSLHINLWEKKLDYISTWRPILAWWAWWSQTTRITWNSWKTWLTCGALRSRKTCRDTHRNHSIYAFDFIFLNLKLRPNRYLYFFPVMRNNLGCRFIFFSLI